MHIYCMSYLAKPNKSDFVHYFSYFMSHKMKLIINQIN